MLVQCSRSEQNEVRVSTVAPGYPSAEVACSAGFRSCVPQRIAVFVYACVRGSRWGHAFLGGGLLPKVVFDSGA